MTPYDSPADWIRNGFAHKVKSADDIMRAIGRVGTLQVGRRYVWRGVANCQWRLQSSLLRDLILKGTPGSLIAEDDVRLRELALIRAARSWGICKELGAAATDLQVLATLQHHGAPTRLLDVTSNPMTALWFACERTTSSRDTSGALMAFDVTGLDVLATAAHELPATWGTVKDPLGWHLENALSISYEKAVPFLVRPSYPDQRMVAQEGLFLTGAVPDGLNARGIDGLPLDQADAPGSKALNALFAPESRKAGRPKKLPFVVLVIPAALKRKLLPHLESTYNRSYRQLFPDIAGFVTALRAGNLNLDSH
ncbi:FRG domain-containing protein [Lentzea sp. NPDC058436]|uniref:FRG domain-containing protein n=1 Tax=Lentzea sp. NPDC058436 TaxID=3346499 RepID=UPI00364DC720